MELEPNIKAVIATDLALEAGARIAKELASDATGAYELTAMRGHAARLHGMLWSLDDAAGDPKAFVDGMRERLEDELESLTKAMDARRGIPDEDA